MWSSWNEFCVKSTNICLNFTVRLELHCISLAMCRFPFFDTEYVFFFTLTYTVRCSQETHSPYQQQLSSIRLATAALAQAPSPVGNAPTTKRGQQLTGSKEFQQHRPRRHLRHREVPLGRRPEENRWRGAIQVLPRLAFERDQARRQV